MDQFHYSLFADAAITLSKRTGRVVSLGKTLSFAEAPPGYPSKREWEMIIAVLPKI